MTVGSSACEKLKVRVLSYMVAEVVVVIWAKTSSRC